MITAGRMPASRDDLVDLVAAELPRTLNAAHRSGEPTRLPHPESAMPRPRAYSAYAGRVAR